MSRAGCYSILIGVESGSDRVLKDMRKGAVRGVFTGKAPLTDDVPLGTGQIDWPAIFNVPSTPLAEALTTTFRDPTYSTITLDF